MASSNHVEIEAAKFLQKLIQDSKDEPAKLATKLYVICQHMKMSGKEQSLPYQVISRAMETVISQHGLDIEVLKQARLPLTGGPLIGDSSNVRSMEKDTPDNQMQMGGRDMPFKGTPAGAWHSGSGSKAREDVYGGSSQSVAVSQDPNEMARLDSVNPSRLPVGPGRVDSSGHEFYQGSGPQRSGGLFEHESPSSLDTRSANSQERHDSAKPVKGGRKKETKKPSVKRKRGDSTSGVDSNTDNLQQPGNTNVGVSSRKGKMNKPEMRSHFSDRSGEQSHVNTVQGIGNMEQFSSVSSGRGSIFRGKQDDQISNSTLKHIEEREMPGHGSLGIQKGGPLPFGHDILNSKNVADQFKMGFSSENSQFSRFALNNSSSSMKDISNAQFAAPCGTSKENKNNAFEFPGHFEGSNAGKFGRQGDPYSAQSVGEESRGNESELGTPGRSLDTMNSHVSQGMTGLSGSIRKVHGGVPGSFNPYGMLRPGFPSPVQFNSSSFGSHDIVSKLHNGRSMEASSGVQLMGMNKDTTIFGTSQKSPLCQTQDSKHMAHEFSKGSESSISERGMGVRMGSTNQEEETLTSTSAGKDLEQEGGTSDKGGNAYKMVQVSGSQGQPSRGNFDTGKVPISQALVSSGMPFREQHLKQLRAQCLVFLAFRNGLMPRKLHLEIALGDGNPKEDGAYREMNRSDETSSSLARSNDIREPERGPPGLSSTGGLVEAETSSRDTENPKKRIIKEGTPSVDSALPEEMKRFAFARSKSESEMLTQETVESQAILASTLEPDALINNGKTLFESDEEKDDRTGSGNLVQSSIFYNGASKETSAAGIFQHESVPEEIDNSINTTGIHGDVSRANQVYKPEFPAIQVSQCTEKILSDFSLKEQTKPISGADDAHSRDVLLEESTISNSCGDAFAAGGSRGLDDQRVFETQKQWNMDQFQIVNPDEASNHGNSLMDLEILTEEEESMSTDKLPSPEYSTSEKWIMDHQKRKILEEQNWEMKQKKTEERIAVCFNKLKETVSSSENTSSKTKSVIELKKLQLLHLQRRLRSGFLHDFFKPISSDMERLKSIKKHRHGRRVKQLEKYEQKMKEERLKRIRERQKEFFSEIEAHKERLEDGFKIKRERWKSFNKYVKEFHKRKERIHREKLDRIQREKINLLKNNDVEGYLRMVQDAKSDRVKQLLKETEKYLQKLGSKLQEAKSMARQFEMEMDENRATNVVEKSEIPVLNEDENDQAEHYLESNEKYYLMAHSIKESIAEQPTSLLGGKLREYQMNGLRWLVSLYNNHLNGILADEMGLGKTVQVIALICYLMEAKNDRGPFLVVVPSSVLPGWVSEINFWAPGINKIAYTGPPEERRRLFKERIIPQKFNVLVTTYEYLMNKHDRPKLSKVHWHYIIIDEGHRIKNASCKLNADLKHYQSTHRLLLTGTPLQNNLEELWALLNFLLPNIFNSSEDFSQWFNKPFESGGDTSPDQALLSEEENLLIINRLHQVLRPFVLRRLKHKVENQLPEKIERLVRCEASAYQKLLMKRVEDNLGSIGNVKGRAVHNSVMELRNICNHPYISQLHAEEVDSLLPKHFLPPIVRLCGKLEMLDRLLPKLKATDHRVLFFSTMTRLLDVMEEYLRWKQYRYLRLDGHTSGGDRGALIDEFNRPDSPVFIFLLSIRAGGVGVNLQAADTVIIFDTDWNPQVDLQAQARAHRIGQKKDVLVLRLETVRSVEEQVRAAAEHKLGVANQSITAGFFDNNTSAEDRREYLESLLRECKKEEAAHVLDDDALNDLLARSESEIDVFEGIDKKRHEEEMDTWKSLMEGPDNGPEPSPPSSSRLVTDDDLKALYAAMQKYDESNAGLKRKTESGLDTQHYGRGKRAREVRSYEDQWTEEEFEKLCQAESPESPKSKEEMDMIASKLDMVNTGQLLPHPSPLALLPTPLVGAVPETLVRSPVALPEVISAATSPQPRPVEAVVPSQSPPPPQPAVVAAISPVPPQTQSGKDLQPPSKRGRGRPKRATNNNLQLPVVLHETSLAATKLEMGSQRAVGMISSSGTGSDIYPGPSTVPGPSGMTEPKDGITTASVSVATSVVSTFNQVQGQRKKTQSGSQAPRRRAKKQSTTLNAVGPLVSSMLELPKQTGPALDGSTASAFGHGKQMLVSGASGTSNICTSISPAGNPFSRIPSATPLAPEKCPVVVAQDKERMASRPSGPSKAPTFVSFEVNPISGLQQMVELVPVRTPIPQFGQEKYANSDFSLEKRETEKVTPVCKEKAVSLQTTGGVHHSVIRTGSEQNVDDLSAPAILPVSQDLIEKRTLQMGSMEVISNPKQDLVENRQLASTENVQKTGVGFVGSDSRPCSSSTAINTAQMGLPRVRPTEVAIRQDSVHIGSTPVVRSQDYKNPKRLIRASARQTRSSLEKDKSKGPTAVKRGSRKKGADVPTTEPPIAGMSNSMMPEVRTTTHAYLGPVEVVEKCNTGKAIIMGEKEEPNVNKAGNVSSIELDTINPDVVPVCNPSVGSEIKQHLDLSLVQKNAAIPIEGTARTKENENQLSVQSEEKASLEVESIQIPDQVAAVGLAQSDRVKDAALTEVVSFETSTAEHSEKESGATRSNNVHSSQIIHPEKRSGMEPKSTEISNCSERGEQQGYQNDVSVDVKKSPCTASDECKAPFNDAKDEVTVPVISSLRPIEEVRKDVTSAELVVMSETSTVVTRVPPSENLESATLSSLVPVSPQPNLTTNQVCETPSAKESSAPSHVSESKDLIENLQGHSTIPVVNALIPMTEAKTEPVSTSLENLDDTRNLGHGSTSGPSESNTQLVSESSTVLVSESNIELVPVSIEHTCTASVEDSESNRCISVSGLSEPALDEANDASAADNSLEDRSGTEICNVAMDSKAAGGNNVVNENKVTDFPETAATGSESIGPEVVDKVEVLKKLEGSTSSYDSDRQEHPSPVSINQGSHPVEQIVDPLNIPKAVADSAYIPMQGDSNKAGDSAKHEEADQIKAVDQSEVPGSADAPLHPPSTDDPNRGRDSFGPSAIKDPDHIDMVAPTVSPMEDNNEQILKVITGKDEAIDQGPENIEKADNGACLAPIPVIGPTAQDNIALNSVSSCDDTSQGPTPETADVRKECTNQDLAHPNETDGSRSVPAEPTCGQNDQIQESSVPAEPTCGQNDQIQESSVPAEPTCGQNDQIHETSTSASPVSEIP